jgi:hypothetical protein
MGWGSRRNGHELDLGRPSADRTVALGDVSKAQLAAALNEQSARFKAMRKQLEEATRVLVAIVLEPEAYRFADGNRTVDAAALAKVKNGMELHMMERDGVLTLTVRRPDEPQVEVPQIIVPSGMVL